MKLNYNLLLIPIIYNIIIFKKNNKNYILIYNDIFKFLILNLKKIKINRSLNFIKYERSTLLKNNFLAKNHFNKFFNHLYKNYFIKIKFKGKGYKIGFYKKKLAFYLGRSHKSIFIYKKINIIKIIKNKYKFILLSNDWDKLKFNSAKTIKF